MIYTTLSNILASFYGNFALFFSIIPFLLLKSMLKSIKNNDYQFIFYPKTGRN